jgi:hypothetical protein
MQDKHILYIGQLNYGGTCLQRMETFKRLGFTVTGIDTLHKLDFSLVGKLFQKLKTPLDFGKVNKQILSQVERIDYFLIWIDKGLKIYPGTLQKIKKMRPAVKIVAYSPDDMLNPSNQSLYYLRSIGLYNCHITTKSYNVEELKKLGALRVEFSGKAYDPATHRILQLTNEEYEKYNTDVGFVGQFENERFQSMLFLAKNGIKVIVRGPDWEPYINSHSNLVIYPGFFAAEEYVKIINATKINLCFLRKENRDLQTARSIEIPACGGFMLAERTVEHQQLFKESEEAEYFGNDQELLQQIRHYLANEKERILIAKKGYGKCIDSDYSTDNRLRKILNSL